MSQAGIINVIQNNPQIPTQFDANVGFAVPLGNILNIYGTNVVAGSTPVNTTAAGNTVTVNVQRSQAIAATDSTKIGLAAFDSSAFSVDANGYVTLSGGGGAATNIDVDAHTPPGTDPVVPTAGNIIITGAQVAAGVVGANVIRTNSLAVSTVTIEIQRSTAIAGTDSANNGVSHFDSARFSVDANGFVSLNGSGVGQTITGDSGGALSPTAGNWNILGASTAAGTTPVSTSGAVSTLTINIQKSQAIGATNATNVGLCAFNSAHFSVDANGFVSLTGGGLAIDSIGTQTGTNPITPDGAGLVTINGAVVAAGTNPIRSNGTGANTMAIEVQISQALAATDATKIGLCNFNSAHFSVDANGFVSLAGGGLAIDSITPNSGTSPIVPDSNGNITLVGTGSITVVGSLNTGTIQLTGLTNHAIQIGAGTATLTQLGAGTTGQVLQTNTGADPTWSSSTYPSTNVTGDIIYGSASNVLSKLAIGSAGQKLAVVSGIPAWVDDTIVTKFTASGTWTKNSRTKTVKIIGWGGGGGGGSGASVGAGVSRSGGGGGCCQGLFIYQCEAASLNGTETVTIGAGGGGGAALSPGAGAGNNGTNGGVTSFGNIATYSGAVNSYGTGGNTTDVVGGTAPICVDNYDAATVPGTGGGSSISVAASNGSDAPSATGLGFGLFGGAAGGGGGRTGGGTNLNGGRGGNFTTWAAAPSTILAGGTAGTAGVSGGGAGNAASTVTTGGTISTGTGGGGGGGGLGSGFSGGAGGIPGGGGGGGGGAVSGATSSGGGSGARGELWVIEYT